MQSLSLIELVGPECCDREDGYALCDKLAAVLESGDNLRLDFNGVNTLTGSFLAATVGCLYFKYPEADLEKRLEWTGLDAADLSVVRLAKRNAARFAAANDARRTELVEVGAGLYEE